MTTTIKAVPFVCLPCLSLCLDLHRYSRASHQRGFGWDRAGRQQRALPNVTVSATNTATNVKFTGITNASGEYRIGNLPPGTYRCLSLGQGIRDGNIEGAALELNRTTTANLRLEVGTVSTSVEVTKLACFSTPQLRRYSRLTSPAVARSADDQQWQRRAQPLPAAGRVASSGGTGYGSGPSIGGSAPHQQQFHHRWCGQQQQIGDGTRVAVPNDTSRVYPIGESVSGRVRHSSGGQFNTVVKSGTNSLHGESGNTFATRPLTR